MASNAGHHGYRICFYHMFVQLVFLATECSEADFGQTFFHSGRCCSLCAGIACYRLRDSSTRYWAKAKDTNATEGNVMEALPHESLEYEGLAEEASAQEALDQQWADEMDFWMYPGTPKSVRLNRMYRDNGIDYNANLLQRYNQFGMAGLSVLERSEDYEFRSAFAEIEERVAEHQLFLIAAEGSNSRDRHGSSQRLLRHFSRTELDAQVWISQQRRGYAFHRQSCSIRVSAKKWVTLEAALVQGKRPCQQCFSDYAQRLQ